MDGYDVEFEPYNGKEEEYEFVQDEGMPLGMYYRSLFYPGGCVIFDPRRVLRQFGFIQTVPYDDNQKFRLLPKGSKGTKSTTGSWKPKYDPDPSLLHWKEMDNNMLSWEGLESLRQNPCEFVEEYMDWYNQVSHPFIINREIQDLVEAEIAEAQATQAAAKKASDIKIHSASEAMTIMLSSATKFMSKMKKKVSCKQTTSVAEQQGFCNELQEVIRVGQSVNAKKKSMKRTRQEPGGPSGGGNASDTNDEHGGRGSDHGGGSRGGGA